MKSSLIVRPDFAKCSFLTTIGKTQLTCFDFFDWHILHMQLLDVMMYGEDWAAFHVLHKQWKHQEHLISAFKSYLKVELLIVTTSQYQCILLFGLSPAPCHLVEKTHSSLIDLYNTFWNDEFVICGRAVALFDDVILKVLFLLESTHIIIGDVPHSCTLRTFTYFSPFESGVRLIEYWWCGLLHLDAMSHSPLSRSPGPLPMTHRQALHQPRLAGSLFLHLLQWFLPLNVFHGMFYTPSQW